MFKGALAQDEPFQVVVTDLEMGAVDGITVAAEVNAAAPRTLVVLVTGSAVGSGPIPNIHLILPKPFSPDELRQAVRECMSRRTNEIRS